MKKSFFLQILIFLIALGGILYVLIKPQEINGLKKAEFTISEIRNLRIAIEEYYQKTGVYPNLLKDGAIENLDLLDYTTKNGKVISFSEIYGKIAIEKTPDIGNLKKSNKIYDTNDFLNFEKKGGWLYDYNGETGEIHANLPTNIFHQNIDWSSY